MRHVRECTLCGHPEGFATEVLKHLIGPIGEDARSKQPLWVHRECAIWSPEAFEIGNNRIRGISKALKRGRVTWCARCQKRGATMGCRLDQCPRSFHKYCAQQAGCTFYPDHYLIACKDHAHMYRADDPPEGQTPMSPYSPYPVPRGLPAGQLTPGILNGSSAQGIQRLRNTPPEERMRNARRAVKRLRHETRVTLAAGSDDEEHFQKKDKARLARDKLRLNPVVLGQKRKASSAPQASHAGTGQGPQLTQVEKDVVSEGWAAVGGHASVIQQLKEMVLLPLQYPEVFKHMGITPPRGILFHGAPGSGKTLVARALAGACRHSSSTPVTLFARKGADCLGKFAGEAERTLRLLFDEAARCAPSIIFLDELDGLVPARSSNSSGGDQVFASVVSTLLALMDGVVDRGAVVVIGATNRPEAIDPALRRPGRFDREVHFGLPSLADRAAILKVHTGRWQKLGAIEAPPLHQSGSHVPPQTPLHYAAPTQDPDQQQQPTPRPCKLLLCGEEGAGQRQVAGALLKLAQGVQVHTISLPMLVAGGSGDATVGLVQMLEEAMHRANSHTPLVLYLPTLEAWALETATLTSEEAEEGLAPATRQAATGPTPQRNAQPSITPLKSYPASISPFRGLVSLQARQGGSGGSRGNPTSSATPGRKATSTPARHLSFQQASPAEQQQPVTSGSLPDQADPGSFTLSLPSQRPLRAAMLSPKPDQDSLASPTMSLPSPKGTRAARHSPQPEQDPLASPTMSLPSPKGTRAARHSPKLDQDPLASPNKSLPSPKGTRAARHSPQPYQDPLASPTMSLPSPQGSKAVTPSSALGSQHQEATLMSPSAVGHATAADFQSPQAAGKTGPVTHGQTALNVEHEGNAESVEVYVLSEIWKVFEQVVKQIPATQPLLVLATCQRSLEQLPPVLLRFFQTQSALVTSVHTTSNSTLCNPTAVGSIMTRADRSAGKCHQPAVNKNDMQKGLKLHAEVQRRLKLCGQQLLDDRRIKCAQAPGTAYRADPAAARADLSTAGAEPDGPRPVISLAAVAQRAQHGHFDRLEAFAEAVRQSVASICQSVEDRLKRQGRHSKPGQAGYSVRAAAACALGDDNGIASPHDEEAEGGKQTEQDCTATAEQLRMSSQGNDAGPGQGNCVPGQHFAALRQAPGVPGLYSHSSERLQKQPALELAAVHDNYAQAADHQDEQADHLAEQMPDFSDQADDHARQAGQNGAATQHINEQANYAAASLQPTTDAQEGWHKDNAAQTQLKVRRLSLQLRQKLQDSLPDACLAVLRKCAYNALALQECHEMLTAGMLENLPAVSGNLFTDMDTEQLACVTEEGVCAAQLQQFHNALLEQLQTLAAGVKSGNTT
ncbi:hypothetical protein WJX82_009150 [Trebouxia sp. C0006]